MSSVWVFTIGIVPQNLGAIYATREALEREFDERGYTILPRKGKSNYEIVTIGEYCLGAIEEHEVVA